MRLGPGPHDLWMKVFRANTHGRLTWMRRALDSPLYYTHKLHVNKLHEKAARRHDKRAAPILLPGRSL